MKHNLTIALFTITFAAILVAGPDPVRYDPQSILVRFNADMKTSDIHLRLDGSGMATAKLLVRRLNIWKLKIDTTRLSVSQALGTVREWPSVVHAQPDHYISQRNIPDDPNFPTQWNFQNTGQSGGVVGADIDAVNAWDITTGGTTALGREIVVAVVDNGIQLNHPDLMANVWINTDEIPGNGIDDDNNGYIDDINGWNAYDSTGTLPIQSHGTHVSGTVGAVSNNTNQVAGINWHIKIMFVAGSTELTSVALAAYGYVLDQKSEYIETNGTGGAFVVATNSSFGINYGDCTTAEYSLWNDMYTAMGEVGILSAAATMNINSDVDSHGDVPTSCSSPYLVTVTNTTRTDIKYNSAAWGALSIDLGAPGSSILSTDINNGTSLKSGTSMASPHVAGAVGFMHAAASPEFEAFYEAFPAEGALALKQILLDNVDSLPSLQNITVSGGRLNLFHAAQAIQNYNIAFDTTHFALTIVDTVLHAVDGTNLPGQIFIESSDTLVYSSSHLLAGSTFIDLTIHNATNATRTWTLINGPSPVISIPAQTTVNTVFQAPPVGTYVYGDTSRTQRTRGLSGMFVREPPTDEATRVFTWDLTEWDPAWLDIMNTGSEPEFSSYGPLYFTINGLSAPDVLTAPETQFSGVIGDGVRIHVTNSGLLPHTLHFHGYHVSVVSRNGVPVNGGLIKDSVPIPAGESVTLWMIFNKPGIYPVYDAGLLSVTGAGVWPNGMLLQIVVGGAP